MFTVPPKGTCMYPLLLLHKPFVAYTTKYISLQALSDHPQLVFVKPKWIHTCHEKEKLMPYQHYIVIPNSD